MLFVSGRIGLALEVVATMGTSIIWFRRDLRLADHPALLAALAHGTTTPLFVLDPLFVKRSGAARYAFLLRNIRALDASMNRAIVVRHGTAYLSGITAHPAARGSLEHQVWDCI